MSEETWIDELVAELDELRRREREDEEMTTCDYRRWNEITALLLEGYDEEARKYEGSDS